MLPTEMLAYQSVLSKTVAALLLFICVGTHHAQAKGEGAAASVVGIHHIDRGFRIDNFYLNGGSFANVGPEGGGSGYVCCIVLPRKWRPGLSADVRWSVADYRNANFQEIEKGNWSSVQGEGVYQAQVPVEKYLEPPSDLYVHFFSGGRVRIVPDTAINNIAERPAEKESASTAKLTTQGKSRSNYFTDA